MKIEAMVWNFERTQQSDSFIACYKEVLELNTQKNVRQKEAGYFNLTYIQRIILDFYLHKQDENMALRY